MTGLFKKWLHEQDAVAAIEAALLVPLMLSIMFGVVDVGMALNTNQKVVNATSTMADLLTREENVTNDLFNEAVTAGQLTMAPYDIGPMGYDVAGIKFLTPAKTPTVEWRDTFNMEPNPSVTADSTGMGNENEGVVAVTVKYTYEPFFSSFVLGAIPMQEVFYARGRKSSFVTRSS